MKFGEDDEHADVLSDLFVGGGERTFSGALKKRVHILRREMFVIWAGSLWRRRRDSGGEGVDPDVEEGFRIAIYE